MKRGFTLIELLVVVAIMGLLGTASVGGYRQMQRGMEERGVMQNVNSFMRAAYQRAQIDRQPTAVYFWNETLRAATDDENEVVVGRAVAVRRNGRITRVESDLLIDEFADLNLTYPSDVVQDSGSEDESIKSSNKALTMRLYQLDAPGDGLKYSVVRDRVESTTMTEIYLTHDAVTDANDTHGKGEMTLYGFVVEQPESASWKVGSAYGFEFASIELPHGYVFGPSYSHDVQNPVQRLDGLTVVFKPGSAQSASGGTVGTSTVPVYSLRPGASGQLSAQKVGTSDSPTKDLN